VAAPGGQHAQRYVSRLRSHSFPDEGQRE
jgi:hypothetical protein